MLWFKIECTNVPYIQHRPERTNRAIKDYRNSASCHLKWQQQAIRKHHVHHVHSASPARKAIAARSRQQALRDCLKQLFWLLWKDDEWPLQTSSHAGSSIQRLANSPPLHTIHLITFVPVTKDEWNDTAENQLSTPYVIFIISSHQPYICSQRRACFTILLPKPKRPSHAKSLLHQKVHGFQTLRPSRCSSASFPSHNFWSKIASMNAWTLRNCEKHDNQIYFPVRTMSARQKDSHAPKRDSVLFPATTKSDAGALRMMIMRTW